MSVLFVGGIDTDIGKTYATGLLAKALHDHGCRVITQKLVQTGCTGIAEDIITHRKMMGIPLQKVDFDMTTCPYVFKKPASPHLASALEDQTLDCDVITQATNTLKQHYDIVLLEGAGGLLVPLTDSLLTLDYIAAQGYPVILVTSGRLGSINHTLLSFEAVKLRALNLYAVIYNNWQPDSKDMPYPKDEEIVNSSKSYLKRYLKRYHPRAHWVDLPNIKLDSTVHTNNPAIQTLVGDIDAICKTKF